MKKQQLLNTYVNNVTMTETVQAIERMIESEKKFYIVAINVDVVVKIEKDKYLKEIIDKADLTLVDGKPLVWISKWYTFPSIREFMSFGRGELRTIKDKNSVKEKISGSDLIPILLKKAAEKGYSVFIIGGGNGVAEKARWNIEKKYKHINIVGTYAPPFGFEKDGVEIAKMNTMISSVHPDILIVCFGCPKQEKWIYENYQKYNAKVSICAGATVDFLSGNVKRAPKWISEHGFEWLWRCVQEPRRLMKRYFVDDIAIFSIARKYRNQQYRK